MTPEEQTAPTVPAPAMTLPAPPPLKTCGCGKYFAADEWERLSTPPGGGVMDLGDGEVLSLRNCDAPCFSTLALEMTDDREDFADEWAREERRERELEWSR